MSPLILLHGFTGGISSWDGVTTELGDAGTLHTLPLLGHEASALREASPRSFEQELDRLAGLVRARSETRSHLAGYSLGARLALGLLVRHPGLWLSATLIGVHPGLHTEAERSERRAADAKWQALLTARGIQAFVAAWEAQPLFTARGTVSESLLSAQRALRLSHRPEGLARSLEVVGLGVMPNYWPKLARLTQPVTLLTGALDTKFSALASRAAPQIPRGRWASVPAAGHNLLLEAPRAVATYLLESIRDV